MTVDRFEGETAVLLVQPDEEGEILEITPTRDIRETGEARARVSSVIEKLRQKGT